MGVRLLLLALALVLPQPSLCAPHASASADASVELDRAHIVWMNHLDVGFTNNIASVMNIYFHEYFPRAIATAKAVNRKGQPPIFKYTSHAWLLDLFFSCPTQLGLHCNASAPNAAPDAAPTLSSEGSRLGKTPDYDPACVVCPSPKELAAVEQAIRDDVITWHAFPFNAEPEVSNRFMVHLWSIYVWLWSVSKMFWMTIARGRRPAHGRHRRRQGARPEVWEGQQDGHLAA